MNTTKSVFTTGILGLLILTGGCMNTPDSSPDYGASVTHMAQQQTYDPSSIMVAPQDSMAPVDGEAAERAVTGYREAATPTGDTIQNEIHINVGN